jgi:hypothetical protein
MARTLAPMSSRWDARIDEAVDMVMALESLSDVRALTRALDPAC